MPRPTPQQTSERAAPYAILLGHARRLARWVRALWLQQGVEQPDGVTARLAARFRARHLQAVVRLMPLTMLTNLLNAALIVATFWPGPQRAWALGWGLLIGALAAQGLVKWWRQRRRRPTETASPRALQRAATQASLLALAWAALPALLFEAGPPEARMLLAAVVTGMIGAGGFVLATLPVAGTAYVVLLSAGSAWALWHSGTPLAGQLGLLLGLYAGVVIASVWATARLFAARLHAEAEAERQSEVIGLLLRDFEENASDVLLEIDAQGRLRHCSPRLAQMLGLAPGQAAQAPVLQLLRPMARDPEARQLLAALEQTLAQGSPFRDLLLALQHQGNSNWWSLSAKPLVDERGQAQGWRGVARDVSAARQATRQLSWLAHNDALTGLANRHHFRSELAALLAQPDGPPARALLCLDLDHFKAINDRLGHAVGDGLLRQMAQRLQALVQPGDLVARLGGDEFALLLQAAEPAEAERLARQITQALSQPCVVQGLNVSVRASVGLALLPRDGDQVDTLLNHADLALYAAKHAGRDAVRSYSPEMSQQTRRRLSLEQALRLALAAGQLRLVYQPQVALESWTVVGFEALLRWRHPDLGEISPAEFVPVAEACGLIQEIGHWVLQQACSEAVQWPGAPGVAVNVSPVQAMSPDFVATVQQTLQQSGLPPARLELEITESMLIDQPQQTAAALLALRRQGVQLALDDFGTGYSALAYLRRYPLSTLKIDRGFVREINQRGDARALVRMIIGLARTFKMRTVAEGVEEPAQAAALAADGCELLQGWLTGRPMEAAEVAPFLRSWDTRPRPAMTAAPPTAPMPLQPA